jgi:hypothetical protein
MGWCVRIPPGAWTSVSCECCVVNYGSRRRTDHNSRGALIVKSWPTRDHCASLITNKAVIKHESVLAQIRIRMGRNGLSAEYECCINWSDYSASNQKLQDNYKRYIERYGRIKGSRDIQCSLPHLQLEIIWRDIESLLNTWCFCCVDRRGLLSLF